MAPSRRKSLAILGARGIPARYGGFETFVEELGTRLVARGHDVTVFCEFQPGPRPTTFKGVKLEYVKAWAPGPARTIQYDLSSLWQARRFEVVYMLGYGASFGLPIPRLFGAEVWMNMDGLEWRRSKWGRAAKWWLKFMEGVACKTTSRLIFDNKALADEVRGRRLTTVPYEVIEYGAPLVREPLDPAPLEAFGLKPDGYHIVVARCEPENHLVEIARAGARREGGLPLVIVSNTDADTPYAKIVRGAAGERVQNLGPIYDPSILQPLRQHALSYVHGHSVGGTNPSLIEALGCGNLVIAHDNVFNREVLGWEGRFFSTEGDLAQRLDEVESMDPAKRHEIRKALWDRAASWYSWERITDAYAVLLGDAPGRSVEQPSPQQLAL
tara:strand:+ start:27674 stop:28825 length:1152 start_codon:yes stop_codon:yes gene_type:complete